MTDREGRHVPVQQREFLFLLIALDAEARRIGRNEAVGRKTPQVDLKEAIGRVYPSILGHPPPVDERHGDQGSGTEFAPDDIERRAAIEDQHLSAARPGRGRERDRLLSR